MGCSSRRHQTVSAALHLELLIDIIITEGGTRSDARFCHNFSCEFHWLIGNTASNKMLGELLNRNVQNLYVRLSAPPLYISLY